MGGVGDLEETAPRGAPERGRDGTGRDWTLRGRGAAGAQGQEKGGGWASPCSWEGLGQTAALCPPSSVVNPEGLMDPGGW